MKSGIHIDVHWTSKGRLMPTGLFCLSNILPQYQLNKQKHKKSPTILGSILICHKKDENSVKRLCDTILYSCPGLSLNLKVIGADGESSILNQACTVFPAALLIICITHIRENIKRNLPSSLPEKTKKSILDEIFGTPIKKGLVDCIILCEFDS